MKRTHTQKKVAKGEYNKDISLCGGVLRVLALSRVESRSVEETKLRNYSFFKLLGACKFNQHTATLFAGSAHFLLQINTLGKLQIL